MKAKAIIALALLTAAAGLGYAGDLSDLFPALVPGDDAITAPRLTSGDLDGDGVEEVVVAGRVGPFRAVTDPFESKQARIDVFRLTGGDLALVWSSPNLHVINDVATGDVDGDGAPEIVAIGDYRMYIYRWEDERGTAIWSSPFARGRAMRIDMADLDSDGRAELVVAEQVPRFNADLSPTQITVYSFDGQVLLALSSLWSDMHVGDLALTRRRGAETYLFFEEGGEEEGGTIVTYGFSGTSPRLIGRELLIPTRQRALALSVEAKGLGQHVLAVGCVSGDIRIYGFDGGTFSLADRFYQSEPGAVQSGLLLRDLSRDGLLQLITARKGESPLLKTVVH